MFRTNNFDLEPLITFRDSINEGRVEGLYSSKEQAITHGNKLNKTYQKYATVTKWVGLLFIVSLMAAAYLPPNEGLHIVRLVAPFSFFVNIVLFIVFYGLRDSRQRAFEKQLGVEWSGGRLKTHDNVFGHVNAWGQRAKEKAQPIIAEVYRKQGFITSPQICFIRRWALSELSKDEQKVSSAEAARYVEL